MSSFHSTLVVAAVVLAIGAAPARADKCTGAKLKATGKKESGLLGCQAKVAAKGDSSGLSACEAKVVTKFTAAFAKAGACAGDVGVCEAIADGCESSVAADFVDAFPSKCEASKRKAAGKLAKGELGCYSKAAKKGLPVDTVICVPKATAKFSAALTKAGTCPDGGTPQSLVESNCVQPAVTTDGGGMVIDVCPTTTTTSTTTTTTETTTTSTDTTTSTTSTTATTLACGTFLTAWAVNGPGGVAVDGDGNVFVANFFDNRIEKFANDGTPLTTWGSAGSGDGEFSDPEGVAVDGSGNVFVADFGNDRVQKFTNTGTFDTAWGSAGTGDGQFNGPEGVAVDGSGNVFVGDYSNSRIQKFTNTGTFADKWTTFSNPDYLAIDGSGNVFVTEPGDDRIQKFTNAGSFLTQWGSLGSGDGQFNFPLGVAVDGSGNVFVADKNNDRIQAFGNTGTFLMSWGSTGTGDGQFDGPFAVAVDGSGNVFVGDGNNNRIQKFACPGGPATTTTTTLPPSWMCDQAFYGTNDGCDCGCGLPDPDCADATVGSCQNCDDTGSCATGPCPANIDPTNNAVCIVWTCDLSFYGASDGCDCGCGSVDPDCADATVGSCQYCDDTGSCGTGPCPANIDPTNNAVCTP